MIINRILVYCFLFLFIHILPSWNYQLETCCSNEKTINNTDRLLSCPVNFLIKLRSVIFYTGNGCAPSACHKRLNKHYLPCNNHRTCPISIKCILMDATICPWLTKPNTHSQHLVVDYDCILSEPEPPLIALNRLQNNNNKTKKENNIVLFSANVKIESPSDLFNDSLLTDEEYEWKEYFLKKYLHEKKDKTIHIQSQRSLFSDILRTVLILIIFAFILIVLMLIALFIYKRIRLVKKRKLYDQEKHQPFPADDAYDNLKATTIGNGSTTDV